VVSCTATYFLFLSSAEFLDTEICEEADELESEAGAEVEPDTVSSQNTVTPPVTQSEAGAEVELETVSSQNTVTPPVTQKQLAGSSSSKPPLKRRKTDKGSSQHAWVPPMKCQQQSRWKRNRMVSDSDSDLPESPVKKTSKPVQNRSASKRVKWSDEEITALKTLQKVDKSLPTWADIEHLKQCFSVLNIRTKEQIKARFVHWQKTGH